MNTWQPQNTTRNFISLAFLGIGMCYQNETNAIIIEISCLWLEIFDNPKNPLFIPLAYFGNGKIYQNKKRHSNWNILYITRNFWQAQKNTANFIRRRISVRATAIEMKQTPLYSLYIIGRLFDNPAKKAFPSSA